MLRFKAHGISAICKQLKIAHPSKKDIPRALLIPSNKAFTQWFLQNHRLFGYPIFTHIRWLESLLSPTRKTFITFQKIANPLGYLYGTCFLILLVALPLFGHRSLLKLRASYTRFKSNNNQKTNGSMVDDFEDNDLITFREWWSFGKVMINTKKATEQSLTLAKRL